MEVVRQFIDANKLKTVVSLPETMQNSRLEIIILSVEDEETDTAGSNKSTSYISDLVDSLTGIIPDNGMTLEDYRAEFGCIVE